MQFHVHKGDVFLSSGKLINDSVGHNFAALRTSCVQPGTTSNKWRTAFCQQQFADANITPDVQVEHRISANMFVFKLPDESFISEGTN